MKINLTCPACGSRITANGQHFCPAVTKADLDALRDDVRTLAAWLLAVNNGPHREFAESSEAVQSVLRIRGISKPLTLALGNEVWRLRDGHWEYRPIGDSRGPWVSRAGPQCVSVTDYQLVADYVAQLAKDDGGFVG